MMQSEHVSNADLQASSSPDRHTPCMTMMHPTPTLPSTISVSLSLVSAMAFRFSFSKVSIDNELRLDCRKFAGITRDRLKNTIIASTGLPKFRSAGSVNRRTLWMPYLKDSAIRCRCVLSCRLVSSKPTYEF